MNNNKKKGLWKIKKIDLTIFFNSWASKSLKFHKKLKHMISVYIIILSILLLLLLLFCINDTYVYFKFSVWRHASFFNLKFVLHAFLTHWVSYRTEVKGGDNKRGRRLKGELSPLVCYRTPQSCPAQTRRSIQAVSTVSEKKCSK